MGAIRSSAHVPPAVVAAILPAPYFLQAQFDFRLERRRGNAGQSTIRYAEASSGVPALAIDALALSAPEVLITRRGRQESLLALERIEGARLHVAADLAG